MPDAIPESFDIDLGDGHWLKYCGWWPDRSIPSNAALYAGIADIERVGATIYHRTDKTESGMCTGFVYFDTPEIARIFTNAAALWQVPSWDPLTLSPSVLCGRCGDHGFVRAGRWERV